jgi:Leucine-rich repeat (LRR) protein
LDKLTNLKYLDLSFNFIEKIENLHNLVHLEDLSLFHNKITFIDREEIESLRNLNSLSLGYNKLNDVHKLGMALRGLTNL